MSNGERNVQDMIAALQRVIDDLKSGQVILVAPVLQGNHFAEAARIAKRVKDQEPIDNAYAYRDLADAVLLVIGELQQKGGCDDIG